MTKRKPDAYREQRYGSPWLTVDEAAVYCRCSAKLIRQAVNVGMVEAHPSVGRSEDGVRVRRLVHKADLDALIESRTIRSPLAEALGA